ncbi:MAG TPA: transcription antitermination factor NusB [bacterium]|nr:transcription antitermination factor NusB [bacterium]
MQSRSLSREVALQILYQMNFENFSEASIDYTFNELGIEEAIKSFAMIIIDGVKKNKEIIDAYIEKKLINWRIDRISLIDKTLLRMGIFEIAMIADVPKNVTISEIIKLSNNYSDADTYRFINGILDNFEKTGNIKTALINGATD